MSNIAHLIQNRKIITANIAERGPQGIPGEAATIEVGTVTTGAAGTDAVVTNVGTENAAKFDFVIPRGDKGDTGETGPTGNGIASYTKTSTSGLVDTYTITFTNGNTTTVDVTNGKGISSIAKTSTSGLVDTYTITYNDNTSSTFTVTNGYSPTATVTKSGDVSTLTVTDQNGTTTTQILDGGVNTDLSNLSSTGENRLHALKGYSDAGELLTDAEGLADVKSYAHSTFDLSKFTVAGSPTITADGIVSGLSTSNYLYKSITLDLTQPFIIEGDFNLTSMNTEPNNMIFAISNSNDSNIRAMYLTARSDAVILAYPSTAGIGYSDAALVIGTPQYGQYNYTINYNGTSLNIKLYLNGNIIYDQSFNNMVFNTYNLLNIGINATHTRPFDIGSIDLKQFSIKINGATVFSGNKTGTDNYTIGGSTVTVPYTLSKTGSKIVDSYYRTQVQAVYNEFGYSPYYTLSDSDFTLPMGELYGMLTKASDGSQCMPSNTYINLTLGASGSTYTAPANGWFLLDKFADNEQHMYIGVPGYSGFTLNASGYQALSATIPVKKGDVIKVDYNASGTLNYFRFIYAVGAESEAQ